MGQACLGARLRASLSKSLAFSQVAALHPPVALALMFAKPMSCSIYVRGCRCCGQLTALVADMDVDLSTNHYYSLSHMNGVSARALACSR